MYAHTPPSGTDLLLKQVQIHTDSACSLPGIDAHQRPVPDLGDDRRHGLDRPHLPGRVLGIEHINGRINHKIIEGPRLIHQGLDGLISMLDTQITGIQVVPRHSHEGLGEEAAVKPEGVEGGLLPRRVPVKGEDHTGAPDGPHQLNRPQGIVGNEPADYLGMVLAKGRSAGGHSSIDTGKVAGHDIGVPLDDDHLALLDDGILGQVDTVENLVLPVELGIGGVDVLGADAVVLEELAGTEPQGAARRVANGPGHPAAEVVIDTALALSGQPRIQHLLLRESLGGEVTNEVVPAARGVTASEMGAVSLGEGSPCQEFAGGQGLLGHDL